MADTPQPPMKFPDNAYRELKPGEEFVPMVPPNVTVPEMTPRMLIFGLIMNIVFSVAATFLALKAGQGIETAIPISILAVGLSGFLAQMGKRASSILENVYVLAISTTSGYVAGGTCFTMPAIYILKLNSAMDISPITLFLQIALVPFLGAILGVIFLIPFRRYFVKEMHGKLPFPEATATNEILVTGASGSTSQAWILIYSFVISAIYTFCAAGLRLFGDVFTTGKAALHPVGGKTVEVLAFGDTGLFAKLTTQVKAIISMGTGAYYLGLGFIIGLRYASIICAGGFLSMLVITPILGVLDFDTMEKINPAFEAQKGAPEEAPRFILPLDSEELLTSLAALSKAPEDDAGEPIEETEEQQAARTQQKLASFDQLKALMADQGYRLRGVDTEEDKLHEDVALTAPEEAGGNWSLVGARRGWEIRPVEAGFAFHALEPGAHEIWYMGPRMVGIGAIFTAGLLSIIKMAKVIVTALTQALGGLFSKKGGAKTTLRTDEDISYGTILLLGLAVIAVMFVFFRFAVMEGLPDPWKLTIVSVIVVLVIAFLFTTVSAWAIAMISVTPISGMTVTTIIIAAVLLTLAGLPKGEQSMLATLLVGGVVCTALSMAGGLVTNFKMGYWLGASPKRITWNAIGGAFVSSIFVCGTIMVLAYKPGYSGPEALSAPQANMMAGALESFLGSGDVPWLLYGTGVVMALTTELIGISALAFGLGMYLPLEINLPILVGAYVAHLLKKTKDEKLGRARNNKGILIASGLIAGGAIMEVLLNMTGALDDMFFNERIMKFLDISRRMVEGAADGGESLARTQNWVGLVAFLGLCLLVYLDCRRAKASEAGPDLG
jgi:uncharacterized oligopeptide transporter (OPT) family protein